MKICYTFGGVGLFALSLTASALSLGQSQGQVVLGAPLDLVFQLQPDADADAASSCVTGQVLLGERRIDSSRVTITPMARRAGQTAAVRLRASIVVDEPVVVVRLAAGCQGQTSRSYTFFAELPETVAANAVAAGGKALDIVQLSALPAPAAEAPVPPAARATAPVAPRRATPPSNASAAVPKPPPAPKPRKPVPRPTEAPALPALAGESGLRLEPRLRIDSRLRMEPLDTWSAPASGAVAAGAATAAGASAAGNPGALPDVSLPAVAPTEADQRVLALETQIQAMKARDASQSASLARINSQLEALQAASEQGSPWTLPLLAALAILLAVLAWLLLRLRSLSRTPPSGWMHSGGGSAAAEPDADDGDTVAPPIFPAAPVAMAMATAPHARQEDIASEFGPSIFSADASAFAVSRSRDVVKPEELFDVRQQAEFFTSVGEYEQAIAVMRQHIAEHEDSSPLAYLELLGLFYQLSRKSEYEALRQQFEQHFAVSVPDMAQFAQRGRSLAHYPDLLANIEALWPTEEVGEQLEHYLFRRPGPDSGMVFDLEAFDDLLLLQAVARTTPAGARGQTVGRRRTTPTTAEVEAPPTVAVTAAAAAAAVAAGAPSLPEQPWATLERAGSSAPALVPLPSELDMTPLSLDIPSRFDVPEGPFARAEPLAAETDGADMPAASSLLDIDLSDVGRWQPLDLPAVEPLPFDLGEFPKRPIVGSMVDQNVGFNAVDPQQALPDELELTPWEGDSPDSIFSAWNAARTDRVIAKPVAEGDKKDKPQPGNLPD